MLDKLRICNMVFYAYHGTSPAERKTGNRFEVDVELHADLSKAAASDRLKDTINYTRIYHLTQELFTGRPRALLETVAYELAETILKEYKPQKVIIRVRKKIPPIPGNLDHIELEVEKP